MSHCPNCGGETAPGSNFCQSCGAELPPESAGEGDAHTVQQSRDPQTTAIHQPETVSRTGEPRGQRTPGPSGTERGAADSDGGITRRHLLAGGGGLAVAGAAGWYFFLGEDRGPAETVEAIYAAINEEEYDRAMSLIHDEGPANETVSRSSLERSNAQVQITETEVLEQSENRARVRITVTREEMTDEQTAVFELRSVNGQWKLWDTMAEAEAESAQPAPTVRLSFEHESGTDGDVVTISHDGGDELDGRSTSVTISEAPSAGANGVYDWTVLGGPASATAGDELTIDQSSLSGAGASIDGELDLSGATVEVVWNASNTDQTATIGVFEVPA